MEGFASPEKVFLRVSHGDLVAVLRNDEPNAQRDCWIGKVLQVIGSARGKEPSLFQIACIETGRIHMVNADLVIEILKQ